MSNECCQNTESNECCQNAEADTCCQDTKSSSCCGGDSGACCKSSASSCDMGLTYGAWLLRGWLAVRAIQTGIEKYSGMQGSETLIKIDGKANEFGLTEVSKVKEYAMTHYHGVPGALMEKFTKEPLMIKKFLPLYDKMLGPALIILGLTILLGIASRTSLFLLGLLYITLTWGLILLGADDGVSWLGIHMVMIVMALALAKHNCLCVFKKW